MSAPEEATRFESHVDRSGEHHIWLGSRNPQRGTGKLKVDGKQVTAHRRVWELANGPLPTGSVVLPCPTNRFVSGSNTYVWRWELRQLHRQAVDAGANVCRSR